MNDEVELICLENLVNVNGEVALILITASKLEINKYKKIRYSVKLKADEIQQRHENRHVIKVNIHREGSESCGESQIDYE